MRVSSFIRSVVFVGSVALACGGRNSRSSAGKAGAAGQGGDAIVAGAESRAGDGGSGLAAAAGSAAGTPSEPESCTPGAASACEDNVLVACSAAGVVERTSCGKDAFCDSHDGVAECRVPDASLGSEVNEYGFALRDVFMLQPCYQARGAFCLTVIAGCLRNPTEPEDSGYLLAQHFLVGGEVGKLYTAHFVVNGIVEAKYYEQGERDRGADFSDADSPAGTDTFYRGGRPIPSRYNSYRLTVLKPDGQRLQHYYLNSFPRDSGFESRRTFPIGYEKDIEIVGGGYVELRTQGTSCDAVNNCGPGVNVSECPAPRMVPNEPDLEVPAIWQGDDVEMFNRISGASQPYHSQIVHLSVTNIR